MRNLTVKVAKMPGKIVEVAVPEGSTARDAIDIAEMELTDGYTLKINETPADGSDKLQNGDLVLISKNWKGNK